MLIIEGDNLTCSIHFFLKVKLNILIFHDQIFCFEMLSKHPMEGYIHQVTTNL